MRKTNAEDAAGAEARGGSLDVGRGLTMKENSMMEWMEGLERLEAVAATLEQAAARMAEQQVALAAEAEERVGRIVATVESARETELERRWMEAEARVAELMAAAAVVTVPAAAAASVGRKTLPVGMATMLAKSGVAVEASMEAGALDGALASLSIEQRIAVKSEMLRAGLLG